MSYNRPLCSTYICKQRQHPYLLKLSTLILFKEPSLNKGRKLPLLGGEGNLHFRDERRPALEVPVPPGRRTLCYHSLSLSFLCVPFSPVIYPFEFHSSALALYLSLYLSSFECFSHFLMFFSRVVFLLSLSLVLRTSLPLCPPLFPFHLGERLPY